MTKLHRYRIKKLFSISIVIILLISLTLHALKENIQLFITPSEITKKLENKEFRLGGQVKKDSVHKQRDIIYFAVTDGKKNISVKFKGIVPALFAENKGVIVSGHMKNNLFIANEVLAKHDENYRPPTRRKYDLVS